MNSAARRADRYDDVAGALEAGLPLASVGRPSGGAPLEERPEPTHPDDDPAAETLEALTAALGQPLPILDRAVFRAATLAGELPRALRVRALAWRERAGMQRELLGRCAYPLFLLLVSIAVVLVLIMAGVAIQPALLAAWFGLLVLLLGGGTWLARRALRHPQWDAGRLPLVGALVRDLGATPWLEALAALLQAGVRIDSAWRQAADTAGTVFLRARLRAAARVIDDGGALGEALDGIVDSELLAPLALAERSGNLAEVAERLARRHSERAVRHLGRLVRVLGSVAFALVALLVAGVVFSFYSAYFAQLRAL